MAKRSPDTNEVSKPRSRKAGPEHANENKVDERARQDEETVAHVIDEEDVSMGRHGDKLREKITDK